MLTADLSEKAYSKPSDSFQRSFGKRKTIVRTTVTVMALIAMSMFIVPMVQAESPEMTAHKRYVQEITDYMSFGIVEQIYHIFFSDLTVEEEAKPFDTTDSAKDTTNVSIKVFMDIGTVNGYLKNYQAGLDPVIQGLAMIFTFFFCCIHIFKELSRGGGDGVGSIEMWARIFIPTVIAILVISYSKQIIAGIESIGHYIMVHVGDLGYKNISHGDGASTSFREWLRSVFQLQDDWKPDEKIFGIVPNPVIVAHNAEMNAFSMIHKLALNAILFIIIANMMSVQVMLYSIWMELFIRKVFFPLAVADCLGEGPRSPGVLYMKRMVAVYVRIAICIMVAFIGDALLAAALNLKLDPSVEMAVPLAIIYVGNIILVFRLIIQMYLSTSQLANQIVGV